MRKKDFIKSLGFDENPFQHANSDREKNLEKYFIIPDYFEDLWGDPDEPVSNIIYAPRGCGKTAQRIMIENRAKDYDNLLTIVYQDHDLSKFKTAKEIDQSYHLEYLNRLMLLSFFNRLDSSDLDYKSTITFSERQFLYKLCKIYLFKTPTSFPNQALASLKTVGDRAMDLWQMFSVPISEVIKKISSSKGVEIDLSKINYDNSLLYSHKDNFINIKNLLKKLGIESIYILVDKVDEQSLTGNDPEDSFNFISSLVRDLQLLEFPGIGFKFFLWDKIQPYCAMYARADRIHSFNFEWDFDSLKKMFHRRLEAFSLNGQAKELFSERAIGRIILFSELSPRDSIRICKTILSEQLNRFPYSPIHLF